MKKTKKTAPQKKIKQNKKPWSPFLVRRLHEGLLIVTMALGVFMLLCFASFNASDPHWLALLSHHAIANVGGRVGACLAYIFLNLFGYMAYGFPALIVFAAYLGCKRDPEARQGILHRSLVVLRSLGFVLVLVAGSGLVNLWLMGVYAHLPSAHAGGWLGHAVSTRMVLLFNDLGGSLILLAAFLVAITMISGYAWLKVVATTVKIFWNVVSFIYTKFQAWREARAERLAEREEEVPMKRAPMPAPLKMSNKAQAAPSLVITKPAKKVQGNLFEIKSKAGLPSLDLLEKPQEEEAGQGFSEDELKDMSQNLENRLRDFSLEAKVVAVQPGPVITRFELELAPGVKAAKLTSLARDLARSLSVTSVRVVEVIPGKSVVGVELPNQHREIVRIREILESPSYQDSSSPLTMALGKDISGYPMAVNLGKMPHLLVAGTTGSGKSVGVNAMILSILYKATPEEVRFIMIDPKMLELSIYEGIPHLLTPVITDMNEAANGLRWCVAEMERRYKYMAALGVRNLASYNDKIKDAIKSKKPIKDPLMKVVEESDRIDLQPLPYVVVVVDEFADMIMVVGKKVEQLITRIAQKARAAGIHLIVATQRPSVDVITGLIKSNIPTRIAFQVSSRIDSRTILDQQGAEQLLGQGDMLYLAAGTGIPIRVHGAFVADAEVHATVADWKSRGEPAYISEITADLSESDDEDGEDGEGDLDDLYDQALAIVAESRKASISYVQRRLRIGFNRAANLLEQMERQGVVSSMDEGGRREVLLPEHSE